MSGTSGKAASSNWLALQKQLKPGKRKLASTLNSSRKRRKVGDDERSSSPSASQTSLPLKSSKSPSEEGSKGGQQISALQQMVLGNVEFSEAQKLPGKYLALDCEMVGVGIDGAESSLARVSLVNFYGAVLLDEFVRQKERVVDYRTQWSGIRESDMIEAKPFEEVQKKVAELLQEKVLIGHAVYNDLKALLLSHPWASTRDTQYYAHKFGLCKTNRPALRNLVKQELDLTIQSGEHSSVTDARATMAVYRLYKKEWEKGSRPPAPAPSKAKASSTLPVYSPPPSSKAKGKQKSTETHTVFDSESDSDDPEERTPSQSKSSTKDVKARAPQNFPGGGRKGVSSGLSTVVHRPGERTTKVRVTNDGGGQRLQSKGKSDWWKQLPGTGAVNGGGVGSKGSFKVGLKP